MSPNDSAAALMAHVRECSGCQLTDEDLQSVLLSFPVCLVAHSDGLFDEQERLFLLEISELLGEEGDLDSIQGRLAAAERYSLFHWLLVNKDELEEPILLALREEVRLDPETLPTLVSQLEGMAEISGGTSEVEAAEIERIKTALSVD